LDQEKTLNEKYKNYWLDMCYHILYLISEYQYFILKASFLSYNHRTL